MKARKNKNTITTQIKRSELLSKLRCLGGSSWCSKEKFNTSLALEKVNTAIADLLSHQNLYGFYPDRDYEVKLTKRQMDLMFVFYSYINKGKFNDAYHELWDSIEKSWETYDEDDYLAYDELATIYGLLFTFKLAVELADLKNLYQDTKDKLILENSQLKADLLRYKDKEDKEQEALAKLFEENIDIRSSLLFEDDDNEDVVQIDVEKEFNQMVEDYNQSPENISINPLEIETVTTDEPIKKNGTHKLEEAIKLAQKAKEELQKTLEYFGENFTSLDNYIKALEDIIDYTQKPSVFFGLRGNWQNIVAEIVFPDFEKQCSAEFLQIIFLAIINTDTNQRTFADVIKLLSTATFNENGCIDENCDLAKLLINFRNSSSQFSEIYCQCDEMLGVSKEIFEEIKKIMIDKLNKYKDEVVEWL